MVRKVNIMPSPPGEKLMRCTHVTRVLQCFNNTSSVAGIIVKQHPRVDKFRHQRISDLQGYTVYKATRATILPGIIGSCMWYGPAAFRFSIISFSRVPSAALTSIHLRVTFPCDHGCNGRRSFYVREATNQSTRRNRHHVSTVEIC